MSKIAISICHGGFNLSHKALLKYAELKGISVTTLTVDKSQEDDDHPFGKWKRVRPGEENDRYGIFHFRDVPESWKDYDETSISNTNQNTHLIQPTILDQPIHQQSAERRRLAFTPSSRTL